MNVWAVVLVLVFLAAIINFIATLMQLGAEVLNIRNDNMARRTAAGQQDETTCMVDDYVKPRRKAKARRRSED